MLKYTDEENKFAEMFILMKKLSYGVKLKSIKFLVLR
jgi:hypothetical protein